MMKCTFLLPLVILLSTKTPGQQLRLINEDVLHPDSLILFNGQVNHFRLTGEEELHSYGLTIKNGFVTYTGNGTYLVRNLTRQPVHLSVFRIEEGTDRQQILFTRIYQVQETGTPALRLVREKNETLSNHQVVNKTRLEPVFPNQKYKGPSAVAHFELTAVQPDGSKLLDHLFVSGEFLGMDVLNTLKRLKKGGQLLFTQVVLYTQGDRYQPVADFSMTY